MPATLLARFQLAIPSWPLPLAAAISGGSDSIALMHLLAQSHLHPLILHFNHNLRPASGDEAAWVAAEAAKLGLSCHIGHCDALPSGNLYEAARLARYEFLTTTCHQRHIPTLLIAHQANDSAETLLHHLLRGSGLSGLSSLVPDRLENGLRLIRPLLGFDRETLRHWLRDQNLAWLDDPSNANIHHLRPRLRHQVLPCLEQAQTTGTPVLALNRSAQLLKEANAALEWSLDQLLPQLDIRSEENLLSLDHTSLAQWPTELQDRLLLRLHRQLTHCGHPPNGRARTAFQEMLLNPKSQWMLTIHRLTIRRVKTRVYFLPK
ncbi:MAG: tRNA lysidine(34) synthetase TilS [Magnetococcales bacterium]|nr:tRNA lysidine(34) synthetase TilS [Magnetococcales bacterium]